MFLFLNSILFHPFIIEISAYSFHVYPSSYKMDIPTIHPGRNLVSTARQNHCCNYHKSISSALEILDIFSNCHLARLSIADTPDRHAVFHPFFHPDKISQSRGDIGIKPGMTRTRPPSMKASQTISGFLCSHSRFAQYSHVLARR